MRASTIYTALFTTGLLMKIIPFKTLKSSVLAMALTTTALATLIVGCAAPQQGPAFYNAAEAIRAAQTAGAVEFAPKEFKQANDTYRKAEAWHLKRRTERAQKLLELAAAQANLAEAISEAKHAESSLELLSHGLESLNRS